LSGVGGPIAGARRFSKITPFHRAIGYGQMPYREGAKQRSFAKKK
jgi:hypothetical protein